MKRPVKLGIASFKALGIFVVLGAAAHAGMPYLPLIGPPPLRVLAVKAPAASAVKIHTAAALLNANGTTNDAIKISTTGTNDATAAALKTNPLLSFTPGMEKSLEDAFAGSVFALPTPDLISLTPQMLATYFHPLNAGTNDAQNGPLRVGFLPPLPLPDKSSHAEYIQK